MKLNSGMVSMILVHGVNLGYTGYLSSSVLLLCKIRIMCVYLSVIRMKRGIILPFHEVFFSLRLGLIIPTYFIAHDDHNSLHSLSLWIHLLSLSSPISIPESCSQEAPTLAENQRYRIMVLKSFDLLPFAHQLDSWVSAPRAVFLT